MSCGDSLEKLFEQYDREMADIEVDLAIHEKLLKFMKEKRSTREQQILSMQKDTEETEKELQLLDEKTNELVQSTSLQGEKIEELKCVQKQIANNIRNAQNSLLVAQNAAEDDLDKLHSMKTEIQKFLENNLDSQSFSRDDVKLQNYQKVFSSRVQESSDSLASVNCTELFVQKSIVDEADRLEDLEKAVKEMKMNVMNLEEQINNADVECTTWHEKIDKLNARHKKEKQRRNVISEKYKQRKKNIAELTRVLNDRMNDKKLLSESMNFKQQELNKNKERFEKKSADAIAIQEEVDAITEDLAKLEKW
ncbi:hypothetical protein DINM_004060 [Dirofilaria immitis]|nr:hypothetical protein [Dirofilaria immitis]